MTDVLARRYENENVMDGYPLLYRSRVTMVPTDVFNNHSQDCLPGNLSSVVGFYEYAFLTALFVLRRTR